jgi:mRNA interferase RelE/StbE
MASYKIEWKRSAAKDLKNLPSDLITKVLRAVEQLAENPFPHGVKKLAGSESLDRVADESKVTYAICLH